MKHFVLFLLQSLSSLVINRSNLLTVYWDHGSLSSLKYISCNQNQMQAFPRAPLSHLYCSLDTTAGSDSCFCFSGTDKSISHIRQSTVFSMESVMQHT